MVVYFYDGRRYLPTIETKGACQMGMYMYRVTAKVLTLSDGRKAHVAKYAYKPWRSWDGEKENTRLHFRTGCVASDNMKLKTDLIVTMADEDSEGRLYQNKRELTSFLDDCTFGTDDMPCIGRVVRDGRTIKVTPL
jgi:hypothetical protein